MSTYIHECRADADGSYISGTTELNDGTIIDWDNVNNDHGEIRVNGTIWDGKEYNEEIQAIDMNYSDSRKVGGQ